MERSLAKREREAERVKRGGGLANQRSTTPSISTHIGQFNHKAYEMRVTPRPLTTIKMHDLIMLDYHWEHYDRLILA